MAAMYDQVIKIISKKPELRTAFEIEALMPWFKKKSQLFRSLRQDIVVDILKNCEFSSLPVDYILIQQGEKGDCFYILLRGSVSVHINNTISDEEDDLIDPRVNPTYKENGELDRTKFGNFIVKLAPGESFGELALINKDCIRNASVLTDETTDLLVVNRELYERSIREVQEAELKERTEFVNTHPLFSKWAYKYRRQMAYSLNKIVVPFSEQVIKQGASCRFVYFLIKGQAKVLVDPIGHEHQFSQFYPLADPDDIIMKEQIQGSSDGLLSSKPKKEVHSSLLAENQVTLPPSERRKKGKQRKRIELSVIAQQEIIGDTEFLLELKHYFATVECVTVCQLYELSLKNYERLVTRRNPWTASLLRDIAQIKLGIRLARLPPKEVPLMKTLLFLLERGGKSKAGGFKELREHQSHGYRAIFGKDRAQKGRKVGAMSHRNRGHATERVPASIVISGLLPMGNAVIQEPIMAMKPRAKGQRASLLGTEEFGDLSRVNEIALHLNELHGNFQDWESSDKVLRFLEYRIKNWHEDLVEYKNERPMLGRSNQVAPFKLRRVNIDKATDLKPGCTVVMHKSPHRGISLAALREAKDDENRTKRARGQLSSPQTPPSTAREKIRLWVGDDVLVTQALCPKPTSHSSRLVSREPGTGTILDVMFRRQSCLTSKVNMLPPSPVRRSSSLQEPARSSTLSLPPLIVSREQSLMSHNKSYDEAVPAKRRGSILETLSTDIQYGNFV